MAENIVGKTKFFFVKMNKVTHDAKTKSLTINSDSARTPAGNIIILPKRAANVE